MMWIFRSCYVAIIASLMMFSLPVSAAKMMIGNDGTSQTFTFTVKAHALDLIQSQFFVGANVAVVDNAYAIARGLQPEKFVGITPKTVTLNGQSGALNPLNGAKINHMVLSSGTLPIVVADAEPSVIYFYHFLTVGTKQENGQLVDDVRVELVSSPTLNDATGAVSDGIVGLAAGLVNNIQNIFAAVKPNGGDFGDAGGGIAVAKRFAEGLPVLDTTTGTTANKAAALDVTTTALYIGTDLASITPNIIDMTYDQNLERLYAVLEVTGGADATDGARALVIGRMQDDKLMFDPVAPDAAFTSNNKIVGGTGSGIQVSLYKVRTLQTSSRLNYVIVAGNVGAPSAVGNEIYALPLVNLTPVDGINALSDPTHGTLAKFDSVPLDSFNVAYPNTFRARGFTTPAAVAADMTTNTQPAALVDGGPLPLAATERITDIIAVTDAVFVSIGTDLSTTSQPGVFYSHAILDTNGRVHSWTPWQRASGTSQKIFGFGLDIITDNIWLMPGDTVDTVTTVSVTQWSTNLGDDMLGGPSNDPSVGLVKQVQTELPIEQGGVHNLFVFPQDTAGFGIQPSIVNNQLALTILTSLGKVMLVETGRNAVANIFTANSGDFATGKQVFTDGTLTGLVADPTTKIIAISGGVLQQVGPIMAAEVSRTPLAGATANGYLFVGGTNGLAVLLDKNTLDGWDTSSPNGGLHAAFSSLTSDMEFQLLGNYQNVRKLIADGTYLYVLTNETFDRIEIASIVSGPLNIINLANLTALNLPSYANFSDAVVSLKLGLLATSGGLFRVGNGADITDPALVGPGQLTWTRVHLPEGLSQVTRLLCITPTNQENDVALGGMIYVLNASITHNQARVNRFFVEDISGGPITNTTIQPLNDLFIKNVLSYLIEFGSYRNFIATDGAVLLNSRSGNTVAGPFIKVDYAMRTAFRFAAAFYNQTVVQVVPSSSSSYTSSIRHLLRNTSGSWLVGGDFGLLVNE